MLANDIKKILRKQHYELVGEHSAVQVCRWTKKSLRDEGVCYKEKFYGINSHQCCQMTPSLYCPNQCVHCWRAIEYTTRDAIKGKVNIAKEIIEGCIKAQRKLLLGFKTLPTSKGKKVSKANQKKYNEAQEPMQFAISLSGEPTLYPKIGELIKELTKRGKTIFLVTNGLYPEKIKELKKNKELPTQLYVSVNSTNEKLYNAFHNSIKKDAWKKLSQTLELINGLNCRTVFRINLVKDLNMGEELVKEYAELIKQANPTFIEVKGYMAVGFARKRLGYERMPFHENIIEFSKKLVNELTGTHYKILDEHEYSRVVVLGKEKGELKITNPKHLL